MNEILKRILDLRVTENGNIVYNVILSLILMFVIIKISDYLTNKLGIKDGKKSVEWKYLKQVFRVIILIVGFISMLSAIPSTSKIAATLFTSSSIMVAAIGLASQEALSNSINGMFIIIFKPFVVGDRVRLSQMGIVGTINDINLRHTIITTSENNRMIIPNTVINKESIENFNYEDTRICNFVDFVISYNSNIDTAIKIIEDEITNHSLHIDIRTYQQIETCNKEVTVLVKDLTERGVNLRVGVWTANITDSFSMCSDIRKKVFEKFLVEGIKMAVPVINLTNIG